MKITYLNLKNSFEPGGVKFSKSHFPEIWMGAVDVGLLQRLKGQPTMLQTVCVHVNSNFLSM